MRGAACKRRRHKRVTDVCTRGRSLQATSEDLIYGRISMRPQIGAFPVNSSGFLHSQRDRYSCGSYFCNTEHCNMCHWTVCGVQRAENKAPGGCAGCAHEKSCAGVHKRGSVYLTMHVLGLELLTAPANGLTAEHRCQLLINTSLSS